MSESEVVRRAVAPPATGVADEALSFALEFCRSRVAIDEDPVGLLKQNHGGAHDYFRYGLALWLVEHLAEADATVKEVYVCDGSDAPEEIEAAPAGLTSPLSLLIRVGSKTADLESLLGELAAALTERYRALVAPQAGRLRGLLETNVVDDQEILDRAGYGALITSIRGRPIRVWAREAA